MLKGMVLGMSSIIFMAECQRLSTYVKDCLMPSSGKSIGKAVEEISSHPCSLVVKAQYQNAHWLLPHAIISVLNLHLIFGIKIATPLPMVEHEEEER